MTTRILTSAEFDSFEDAMMAISPYERKQEAAVGFDAVKNVRPTFGGSTRRSRSDMPYGRRADQASAAAEYAAYMASLGM